jgi:hypothetical protein
VLTARIRFGFVALVWLLAAALAQPATAFASDATPLARAHAHNDFLHERPLFDALDHGFTSGEADIWLVDGELLVAHDLSEVQPDRTLESLYLAPLRRIVTENDGSVYPGYEHYFTLLIDIKSEAVSTYRVLHQELRRYQAMLTSFGPRGVKAGAVTAIVSGNRPRELMESQRIRYAAYDGRMSDLGTGVSATFMPLISDNWTTQFTWMGEGDMPEDQRRKLHAIVATAHANGQRVRFWATPDAPSEARENVWRELLAARVDFINTDHLADLQTFLLANDPNPSAPYVTWADTIGRSRMRKSS